MSVSVFRGDDWALAVTVTETIAGVTNPFNLTGATLASTIGTVTATVVVISAAAGTIEVQLPAVTTALFAPGTYPVDVQVTKSGIKRTAVKFDLDVVADVTIP